METGDEPLVAKHPEIPEEHALQGFDGVRAYAVDPDRSSRAARGHARLPAERQLHAGRRAASERGGWYAYDTPPEGRGIPGAGTVHHVAWATTMDDHEAWQAARRRGRAPADAGDRPLLLQVDLLPRAERDPVRARDARPGFATDEDPEHLGERLSLPPDFEHLREQIEPRLTPLPNPRG